MKDTQAAKRQKQVLNIIMPKSLSDPEVKTRSNVGEPLVWQGLHYQPGVLPGENVVRQVLWELYTSLISLSNFCHWTVVLVLDWFIGRFEAF